MAVERTAVHTAAPARSGRGIVAPVTAWLVLLAIAHAITDSYGQSLISPMFPEIGARLHLSLAQIGTLPVLMGLTASLAQPLFGWISDRRPDWCLVALGPLVAGMLIGQLGQAGSYVQLGTLMFCAGLGIGAFHPQGAMLARKAGRGSSLAMSVFTVGGSLGFGLAPVLGALYGHWFGLERFYLASVPAIAVSVILLVAFRRLRGAERAQAQPRAATAREELPACRSVALAALTATVVVRSAVQIGMTTFLPFLVQSRFPESQRLVATSASVSAFLLASAFAGPIGGAWADRFGRRRLMMASFILAPLPLLAGLQADGTAMLAWLALGAFILMLPHPGNVVLAQELMPRSAGIAASLITGLAWGLAQLLAWPLGAAADAVSLPTALTWLCLVPFLGVFLVLPIPEDPSPNLTPAG